MLASSSKPNRRGEEQGNPRRKMELEKRLKKARNITQNF
jgi:hypothetical protein